MGTKLSVQDLRVGFGDETVLNGVTMEIPENQVTAIIGPSGCGKTTYLRSMNRMHDHTPSAWVEGAILLDGHDIYQNGFNPVQLRIRVGMVFQKPNPFPTMSIRDNITFAPRKHGMARRGNMDELVEDVLKRAALWDEVHDRLDAPATGLSGGQQQRLCIARALAVKPDVLLMDEPASALDPVATGKIEELILELKENYTVVIVTHNMHQAARISDQTAFFYMGDLIEYRDTDELFENPSKQRTEDYITGRFG